MDIYAQIHTLTDTHITTYTHAHILQTTHKTAACPYRRS